MATLTVTRGYNNPTGFVSGETVTPAKLNSLGTPTVAISNIVNADIDNAAAIALSKLATGALPTAITVASANLVDGVVSNAKLRDSAALSVIGNSTNASADPADITAGTDGHVLRRSGTALGFGTIASASIADAAVIPTKLSQPYTLATAQNSTSGTSIDFTGIPSWAKRITVMFAGVSTNGTSNPIIQLGDAGGFETTGYLGASNRANDNNTNIAANFTTGFGINASSASNILHGSIVINLTNSAAFAWTAFGVFAPSQATSTITTAGSKALSDTLTQVRITTVNGTDTFDAGTINISYEG